MPDIPQIFNSEEYGWKDLNISYLGKVVVGIREVMWKRSQEKSNVYGAGSEPIARGRGNITYEGSIKILSSEYMALLKSQGNLAKGAIKVAPFDVIVTFAPEIGTGITTFILRYAEFMSEGITVNQGDQQIEIELPIIFGGIDANA